MAEMTTNVDELETLREKYGFATLGELKKKLNSYKDNLDDDVVRFKRRIKSTILKCPELLYVLDNNAYESELFESSGENILMEDGEWDLYLGDNVRDYIFFPETQQEAKNYLCFKVETDEIPRYNTNEKYLDVTFVVFCNGKNIVDTDTGVARHDLLSAIIREKINWSNIFNTQCKLMTNTEGSTDNGYVTRTLVFRATLPNSIVKTDAQGNVALINKFKTKGF